MVLTMSGVPSIRTNWESMQPFIRNPVIRCGVEDALIDPDVEVDDVLVQSIDQVRLLVHQDDEVLHVDQVVCVVPELGELASEDGVLAVPSFDLGPELSTPIQAGSGQG